MMKSLMKISDGMEIIQDDVRVTKYVLHNEKGEGCMTAYHVIPGIDIIYNDFHIDEYFSKFYCDIPILSIDHCREGRIEWELDNGAFTYVESGDMQIGNKIFHKRKFSFPLSHYHGITVAFYMPEALQSFQERFSNFSIDFESIYKKYASQKRPFIIRAQESIQHIFSELYQVTEAIQFEYFKIKILELLLFLSVTDPEKDYEFKSSVPRIQAQKIKVLMEFIRTHIDDHHTIEELSLKFHMNPTSMKKCFKEVYGIPIYAYIRAHRMKIAAHRLCESNAGILEIANCVGYCNSSKFAHAFREIFGCSPKEYRNQFKIS